MAFRFPFNTGVVLGVAGAGLILAGAATQVAAQQPPPGLAAKQARIADMNQAGAAAQQAARPAKPANPQPPPEAAQPALLTGIQDHTGTPPLPGSQFQSTNAWFGLQGGTRVIVFAGASGADPAQGMVVVWALDQAPRTYPTPVRGGAVRITAASGSLLTLTTAQGTHTGFDAAAGQFV
jgi:hypothetical protein